ncbi:Response regulator protein VraR [Falsiruegeria mediterranea M17]|uniref:Response regulator protein VraR n=2 Tax=Falsiruegeria TaxID=2854184 RepID=A0A2R8CDG8_9RHOB|nr:Response regulator protein VraR [Falsiruegeria mediterranea M17]
MLRMEFESGAAGAGSTYPGALQYGQQVSTRSIFAMRILLADDHEMVRDTISAYLETEGRAAVITAPDYVSAMKTLTAKGPFDLVLLDFNMPGMNGLDGLTDALTRFPDQAFAILSGTAPNRIAHQAVDCGAIGFIPKTMGAKSLINAVRFMVAGETYVPANVLADQGEATETEFTKQLSLRERQVLSGLCHGRSNKEIARTLDLQEVTIKLHVRTLCKKLNAKNRTQAALIAKDAGFQAD